jgi:hypothetical protein
MPRAMIIEVANLAREIEENMFTTCKSRWFQPLSDNEDSDDELVDDEQKKGKKEKSQRARWRILMRHLLSQMP